MQRPYKTVHRHIQRHSRIQLDESHNNIPTLNLSDDNILALQNTLGNQAVIQMMRNNQIDSVKPKQSTFNANAFKIMKMDDTDEADASFPNIDLTAEKNKSGEIGHKTLQRQPSSDDARALLPDSEAKGMAENKNVVVNMLADFNRTLDEYPAKFPGPDEIRAGAAKRLHDNTKKKLLSLDNGIIKVLKKMLAYFEKRAKVKGVGRSQKAAKQRQRIKLIKNFANFKLEKPANFTDKFEVMHKNLLMATMVGSNDLSKLSSDDVVGGVDEGAAQGGVHTLSKGQVNTTQGVKTGYFKADELGHDDAGIGIGLKESQVGQSLRAVATYRVSELLEMGVIPYTALTMGQDKDGNTETGQFMEEVKGFTGRGKILADEMPEDNAKKIRDLMKELKSDDTTESRKAEIKLELPEHMGLMGAKEVDGKFYKLDHATADIDWMSAVIQKDLSTLQLFDMIVGHADRHPENYVIETDDGSKKGAMTGVKGIDNDSVWGQDADAEFIESDQMASWQNRSKTPDVPPVLDAAIALRVVSTPWKSIESILTTYGLESAEIEAAESRWHYIQDKVKDMILNNQLAIMDMDESEQVFTYIDLYDAIGEDLPQDITEKRMMIWGEQTAELMTEDNSYAGREQAGLMSGGKKVDVEEYA